MTGPMDAWRQGIERNRPPDERVWCDVEQAPESVTVSGRCASCGATDHLTVEQAQAAEREWIDGGDR